jgi:signal transduction histidine kinase
MGRLERTVDILSSFAPPERVRMLSTDLNHVIEARLEHHREAISKESLNLEVRLDDGGCPSQIDAEKIGWVLDNLIINAMEISTPGQTITVSSERQIDHCRVEVRDQGPGIRPEHLPKIFVPFFTTKEKGTGLSLAACKKIMRDLGGDIQVASTWGEGATFTLMIPR